MGDDQSRPATPKAASRLVYGTDGDARHGRVRVAVEIAAARAIDRGLGTLGIARPVALVSGFWRSGTTWLQECLADAIAAKTVFEPLSPMEPLRRTAMAAQHLGDGEDLIQATIPGPAGADDPVWTLLDGAVTGRIATPFLMSCRRDVGESFRRRVVVKDVRLQANLAGVHARYRVPVVHIRRHPCAVVASLMAADWHWSFARVPLATLAARLGGALPESVLAALPAFDRDVASRIAAFWAITERIAAAELAQAPWGTILRYEALRSDPAATLRRLCARMGLQHRRDVDFSLPSSSIHPDVFQARSTESRDRWRGVLSDKEADAITAAADALFPAWRLGDAAHQPFDESPTP